MMAKFFRLILVLFTTVFGVNCSSESNLPGTISVPGSETTDIPVVVPGGGGGGGGVGGSGFSVGTLTRLGSVYINGTRFDTSASDFLVNGQAGNQNQLRVGMQLTAQVNFDTSAAQNVSYTAAVIGAIESPPDAAGRIVVLNQSVTINAGTILDSIALTDLFTGQLIEVSGWTDANESLIASYIRRANSSQFQLAGTITTVNENSFTVAGVTVRVDQADLSGLNNQSLQPGLAVIVSALASQYNSTTRTLIAATITSPLSINTTTNNRIEISGFVKAYNSATSFNVDGIGIITDNRTVYEFIDGRPLNATAVSLNSLVEIEGVFSANGTVQARRIVVIPTENSKLEGRIEGIDSGSKSLTMFGVSISTTPLTRFSGDSNASSMSFDALRIGDYIEIDSAYIASTLVAGRIEIEDPDDETILEGPVTEVNADLGTLKIVGVVIPFGGNSEFDIETDDNEQSVDQLTFLRQISVGTIVKAKWKEFSSISQPVDEVELELE